MSASAGNPERVEVIDSLRGIAALAVVLYHYIGYFPLLGIPVGAAGSVVVDVTRYGHLGVPVFFVLSGYVIAMTASRYRFTAATGTRFVLRRLVRIAPPYWVMVVLLAAVFVGGRAAGYFRSTAVSAGQVAAHLGYAQELLGFPPLDSAYWTLCLEVQFYLVFAASAVLLRGCRPGVLVGWFAALTAGSVLLDLFDAVPRAWFPRLWYQFGVGVLTCYAGRERSARVALAVLLPSLIGVGAYRAHAADVTAVLVAGLLLARNRPFVAGPASLRLLLWLGRISYSLYLVHGLISIGLSVWFRAAAGRSESANWAGIAAATAGAVAFAAAFYYLCERRAVGWSRAVRVDATKAGRGRAVGPAPDAPPVSGASEPPGGAAGPKTPVPEQNNIASRVP